MSDQFARRLEVSTNIGRSLLPGFSKAPQHFYETQGTQRQLQGSSSDSSSTEGQPRNEQNRRRRRPRERATREINIGLSESGISSGSGSDAQKTQTVEQVKPVTTSETVTLSSKAEETEGESYIITEQGKVNIPRSPFWITKRDKHGLWFFPRSIYNLPQSGATSEPVSATTLKAVAEAASEPVQPSVQESQDDNYIITEEGKRYIPRTPFYTIKRGKNGLWFFPNSIDQESSEASTSPQSATSRASDRDSQETYINTNKGKVYLPTSPLFLTKRSEQGLWYIPKFDLPIPSTFGTTTATGRTQVKPVAPARGTQITQVPLSDSDSKYSGASSEVKSTSTRTKRITAPSKSKKSSDENYIITDEGKVYIPPSPFYTSKRDKNGLWYFPNSIDEEPSSRPVQVTAAIEEDKAYTSTAKGKIKIEHSPYWIPKRDDESCWFIPQDPELFPELRGQVSEQVSAAPPEQEDSLLEAIKKVDWAKYDRWMDADEDGVIIWPNTFFGQPMRPEETTTFTQQPASPPQSQGEDALREAVLETDWVKYNRFNVEDEDDVLIFPKTPFGMPFEQITTSPPVNESRASSQSLLSDTDFGPNWISERIEDDAIWAWQKSLFSDAVPDATTTKPKTRTTIEVDEDGLFILPKTFFGKTFSPAAEIASQQPISSPESSDEDEFVNTIKNTDWEPDRYVEVDEDGVYNWSKTFFDVPFKTQSQTASASQQEISGKDLAEAIDKTDLGSGWAKERDSTGIWIMPSDFAQGPSFSKTTSPSLPQASPQVEPVSPSPQATASPQVEASLSPISHREEVKPAPASQSSNKDLIEVLKKEDLGPNWRMEEEEDGSLWILPNVFFGATLVETATEKAQPQEQVTPTTSTQKTVSPQTQTEVTISPEALLQVSASPQASPPEAHASPQVAESPTQATTSQVIGSPKVQTSPQATASPQPTLSPQATALPQRDESTSSTSSTDSSSSTISRTSLPGSPTQTSVKSTQGSAGPIESLAVTTPEKDVSPRRVSSPLTRFERSLEKEKVGARTGSLPPIHIPAWAPPSPPPTPLEDSPKPIPAPRRKIDFGPNNPTTQVPRAIGPQEPQTTTTHQEITMKTETKMEINVTQVKKGASETGKTQN